MPRYVYSRSLINGPTGSTDRCVGWASVEGDQVVPLSGTPFEGPLNPCGPGQPFDQLTLEAPARPGAKLICAARNYRKHAVELSNPIPSEPLIFLKPASALIGPDAPIALPTDQSELVHHEGELAIVIGHRAQRIAPTQVAEHILGYTLFNDVTARDLQRRDGCFSRAKGFDTFAPMGPWIDTDFRVASQPLRLWVNETLRQEGALDEMLFDVPTLISWLSEIMTLEPGDIIATGTPAGVGVLSPGDTVRIEIEGLGALSNPVRARG
jgi:2-keto-4-pentenoate hydratase/2-oxohepta-3-ene-1,7-dioic acid hydratase in catechol pathway